jgi:hypothetical protein
MHEGFFSLPARNWAQRALMLAAAMLTIWLGPGVAAQQPGSMVTLPSGLRLSGRTVTLTGHTPRQLLDGTAVRIDHYDPNQKLRLTFSLQPPHMAEENEFLRELEDPTSPNFHQYLSPAEWTARFDPSVEDEQNLVDWAQSVGLTVTQRAPNRLIVDLEAPAGVIEKAFGVTINHYRVDEEVNYSNDRDPVIPQELGTILSAVLGLNNINRMHSFLNRGNSDISDPDEKGLDYVPGPVETLLDSAIGDADPAKPSILTMAASQNLAESGGAAGDASDVPLFLAAQGSVEPQHNQRKSRPR